MQAKIADMYTSLQCSRAFAYQVARDFDAGHKSRIDSASCLLHASDSAVQVALEAIQALGGDGYINEYPPGTCATPSSTRSAPGRMRSGGC